MGFSHEQKDDKRISEGGPSEVALLLGKYRGRLSSVEEFIRSKQIEKSLER
jgi:hypothetical protein